MQRTSTYKPSRKTKGYAEYVQYCQQFNPCLRGLLPFLNQSSRRVIPSPCRVFAVDLALNKNHKGHCTPTPLINSVPQRELPKLLTDLEHGQFRVLVIEDLDPSIVETLSDKIDIDPTFFADYISTSLDDIENGPAPPAVALSPSRVLSEKNAFHIHYQEMVDLGEDTSVQQWPWVLKASGNVPRSLRRLPPLRGRQLGILRGCCSILTQRLGQGWIGMHCLFAVRLMRLLLLTQTKGIILVDAADPKIVQHSEKVATPRLEKTLLHNGLEEFQPPLSFHDFRSSEKMDDLRCNDRLKGTLLSQILKGLGSRKAAFAHGNSAELSPLSLAYLPLQVVMSKWVLYTQVVARFLKHYEYSLGSTHTSSVQENDMIDLQKWRHRIIQSQSKLSATRDYVSRYMDCVSKTASQAQEEPQEQWRLLLHDIDKVTSKLARYGQSMEQVIPVATNMMLLLHYERSAVEARFVKRLTYIALVFVPLSWVAALFSMTDDFAPGQPMFWVYFIVSVPLCLFIVGGSMFFAKNQL